MKYYSIQIEGYGGDFICGTMTKEQYDFWKDKDIENPEEFDDLITDAPFILYIPLRSDKTATVKSFFWNVQDFISHYVQIKLIF